ncbi:MAG: hypothetical protein EBX92_03970 [Actinobacteria bacterium]|nr:hypothetical protein [Actinomycetota bacterium]
MPPLGLATQLRIFIDPDLMQYDEVWAAAGTWVVSALGCLCNGEVHFFIGEVDAGKCHAM